MPRIITDIAAAAQILRGGSVVAFPTETVYGLGAVATMPAAVEEIYRIKQRPENHPLIVHILDFASAEKWAAQFPPPARAIARAFAPGAITLLLPRADSVSPALCGGGDYIALRAPAHPIARRLLSEVGDAIAAPSANRFGRISPTAAAHVADEFADHPALPILDGGACDIGLESTIVGFVGDSPFVARPGSITADDIRRAAAASLVPPPANLRAPGALPRHYAPTTPIILAPRRRIMALSAADAAVISARKPAAVAPQRWRRAAPDAATYGKNLYRHLRELDASSAVKIHIEQPPTTPDWAAVNDRLSRAGGDC